MSMEHFMVEVEDVHAEDALLLIERLSRELARRYDDDPEEGAGNFRPMDMDVPGAYFVVARLDRRPVGCGAVRPFDERPQAGEVKRMFVEPEARGKGVGKLILAKLENVSRDFGYAALVLETGVRQPEAIALYEKAGFVRRPCWGKYVNNSWSVCYEKSLR